MESSKFLAELSSKARSRRLKRRDRDLSRQHTPRGKGSGQEQSYQLNIDEYITKDFAKTIFEDTGQSGYAHLRKANLGARNFVHFGFRSQASKGSPA